MFKYSLVAFIVCIVLLACNENPEGNNIGLDSFRKVTDIPFDTSNKHGTTLDSLQGIWASNTDTNDCLTIQLHNHAEVYKEGDKSNMVTAEFYLTDTCEPNMGKLDIRKENGQCMMLTIPDNPSIVLCYQIDYIDDRHLVLLFHGKILGYDKKTTYP